MANVRLENTKLYLCPPVGNCTESVMAVILIWFGWGWVKEWIVGFVDRLKDFSSQYSILWDSLNVPITEPRSHTWGMQEPKTVDF